MRGLRAIRRLAMPRVWQRTPARCGLLRPLWHPADRDDHGRRPPPLASRPQTRQTYTPAHLAEKILTSRAALEGERKQVTVLFAHLKGSLELLADRDPEEARHILDPELERMMRPSTAMKGR